MIWLKLLIYGVVPSLLFISQVYVDFFQERPEIPSTITISKIKLDFEYL